MRPKTSPIWKMPREEFVVLVRDSHEGTKGVLEAFGLRCFSHNYRTLKQRIKQEGLDWEILSKKWRKQSLCRLHEEMKKPLTSFLVEHGSYSRNALKRRLLEEGLLKNECVLCGQGPEWRGKPLVLILDHINGIYNDNRVENIRMLCPHCNSQQDTFAGRNNRGRKDSIENRCVDCGKKVLVHSIRCRKCSRLAMRKTVRPDVEILKKEVGEIGWEATGRKYGVSGNAVKKWF